MTFSAQSTANKMRQPPTRDLLRPSRSVSGADRRGAKGSSARSTLLCPDAALGGAVEPIQNLLGFAGHADLVNHKPRSRS